MKHMVNALGAFMAHSSAEPGPDNLPETLGPAFEARLVEGVGLADHDGGVGDADVFKAGQLDVPS